MRTFATPTRKPSGARAPALGRRIPVVSRAHDSTLRRTEIRHILHGPRLQPKLEVGAPDDAYEREADRVAEAVMRMPEPVARIQRMCPECEEEMRGQPAPRLVLGSSHETQVQRVCGARRIGTPSGCTTATGAVDARLRYLFVVNCDDFRRGNQTDLELDAERIQSGDTVELHGFASIEGDPGYNLNLSCARALEAKRVVEAVLRRRGVTATIRVFTHGATPGNREVQRSVVMTVQTPAPEPPPEPTRRCGPDATDWLIRQVAAAKRDPAVLAVQADLAGASRVAARGGFSAERIAEGGIAKRVLAAESRLRAAGTPPTRTAEFRGQLAASVPGQRAFGRALLAAGVPIFGAREALVLAAIRRAALRWRHLVGTGRRFDFKNDSRTMRSPTSPNCPDDCANTITLCPSSSSDCFLTDVPGNLFFAHVGRFVGWTELSLQLGSQFAQLTSSRAFDSPEDTRMIHLGFGLPDPLTRTALCSAVASNRSIFVLRPCGNCSEPTRAQIV